MRILKLLLIGWTLATTAAAAFDLKDTDAKPQRLADMKGKWVVVNFWATWCAPCIKELPDIAAFAQLEAARARVIGVAVDWEETGKREADEKKVKAFAKKVGHPFPLILADSRSDKAFGKLPGMPTTVVYDPDGKVVYRKTGTVTKELLTRIVNGEKM